MTARPDDPGTTRVPERTPPLRTPHGVFPWGLPTHDLPRGSNVLARGVSGGDVDVFVYQQAVTPEALSQDERDHELEIVAAFRTSAGAFEALFGVTAPLPPSQVVDVYLGS